MTSNNTDNNIWESLLRESSKRSTLNKNASSSLIFLGEQPYKSHLISLLSSIHRNKSNHSNSTIADKVVNGINIESFGINIVEYQYFSTDDGNVVNLWTFDANLWEMDGKYKELDILYNSFPTEPYGYLIVLDLTSASATNPVQTLKKWLNYIKITSSQLKSKYGANIMSEKELMLSTYLHNMTTNPDPDSSSSSSIHNYGFPIMIVGITPSFNIDSPENFPELQRQKLLQSQIRKICMDVGASALFVPMMTMTTSEDKNEQAMIAANQAIYNMKLKKYVIHRLFSDATNNAELMIEDVSGSIFIPAGIDTVDLISASTGHKPSSTITSFEVDPSTSSINSTCLPGLQIEIESEKDWLVNLQSFVNQITAGASQTSSLAPNRRVSAAMSEADLNSLALSELSSTSTIGGDVNAATIIPNLSASHSDEALSSKAGRLSVDTSTSDGSDTTTATRTRIPVAPLSATAATTRRASTRTSVVGDKKENKQDVDEFFRNLLANPSAPATNASKAKK